MVWPQLAKLVFIVMATILFPGCGRASGPADHPMGSSQLSIATGPGEESFSQQYHLDISLPMPESRFIALLKQLGLGYDKCGGSGTNMEIPPPKWSNKIDLSSVQTCYQIYGTNDKTRRVGKIYRAYVDRDHRVIYIENAFAYTGP